MSEDSTPSLVDLILRPLPDAAPAGSDLRLDVTPQSLYFRLRDARSNARAEERQADNEPGASDTGTRHWKTVNDLAVTALTGVSKDIEIAAWLTESLVRSNGLSGLATGARIMCGLVEGFWNDGLFPALDDDGVEARVAAIAGLNGQGGGGTLLQPLRKIVLFQRNDGSPVALWQFEQSEEVNGIADSTRRNQRLASGITPLAELEAEARVAQVALTHIGRDVAEAIAAWQALDNALTQAAGADAPPTRRVMDLLEKVRRIADRYVDAVATPNIPADATIVEDRLDATAELQTAAPHLDRETLLAEITRIAAFFRANEPNSPLGYTLDEAVRRARLGWPDLLKEIVPDAGSRAAFLLSLGLRPAGD